MNNKTDISFKTYCWTMGSTSFRTGHFNYKIETQLQCLNEFMNNPEHKDKTWNELQDSYYVFLKNKGMVKGSANNTAKDARATVSGLKKIGLVNKEARLTEVGKALVDIVNNDSFEDDNVFGNNRDSYIYLNQLLKASSLPFLRPFTLAIYFFNKLDYMSEEEFKYLFMTVVDKKGASDFLDTVKDYRSGKTDIDEVLINKMMGMNNYKSAFNYLMGNNATKEVISSIGMNRKSKLYDEIYYDLYYSVKEVFINNNPYYAKELYKVIDNLKTTKQYWKRFIFADVSSAKLKKEPGKYLNLIGISSKTTEEEYKKFFFEKMHLFRWKATLDDYYDINKRYFKLSNIVSFSNRRIELTLFAKFYFKHFPKDLYREAFSSSDKTEIVTSIEESLDSAAPDLEDVYKDIAKTYRIPSEDPQDINDYFHNEKLKQFRDHVKKKYTPNKLIEYLECFENRDDERLFKEITDNADAPTLFEYVLGIYWYTISGYKGDILRYMNLDLDSDNLPVQHAGGGEADIVYYYNSAPDYPAHTLLLEATLATSTQERRMEMEPVSRHLMSQLDNSDNMNDYAVLVTTFVHFSVIADFRSRANTEQGLRRDKIFDGLKLFVLGTDILKGIIRNRREYKDVYKILENAHRSHKKLKEGWYEEEIESHLK